MKNLIEYLTNKDLTFTVYHVPGVKVGCDSNYPRRPLSQRFAEYEILYQTKNIFEASEVEIAEQKSRGYKVDTIEYWRIFLGNLKKIGTHPTHSRRQKRNRKKQLSERILKQREERERNKEIKKLRSEPIPPEQNEIYRQQKTNISCEDQQKEY